MPILYFCDFEQKKSKNLLTADIYQYYDRNEAQSIELRN